jgi:hypothetical protein
MKKLFIFFLLLTFLHSCKEDCPEEIDPCAEYPADFTITANFEYFNGCTEGIEYRDFKPFDSDTLFRTQRIRFTTNFAYDSITWKVGTDPREWRQLVPEVVFRDQYNPVEVRAFAHRPINTDCFGTDDDGIDTITKTYYFDDLDNSPFFGRYRGTNDGETDSFTIEIVRQMDMSQSFYKGVVIKNFPKDYTGRLWDMGFERTKIYGNYGGTSLSVADGITKCLLFGELDADDRDLFRLKWQSKREEGIQRIFTGRRIQ